MIRLMIRLIAKVLFIFAALSSSAFALQTVMYNSSGIVTSCSNGLTTDSKGRVSGCSTLSTVAVSTAGYWGSGDYNNITAFGPCVGSTFTLTTGNFPLKIYLAAYIGSLANGFDGATVLMDGSYIDAFSSSVPMVSAENNNGSMVFGTYSLEYITVSAVSAGVHNFCVTVLANGANQHTLCGKAAGANNGPCYLLISEYKGG